MLYQFEKYQRIKLFLSFVSFRPFLKNYAYVEPSVFQLILFISVHFSYAAELLASWQLCRDENPCYIWFGKLHGEVVGN